ncbi:transcriptional repressor LexA [Candidatus Saccharibacteria bacterium]|nr:transcriptional repressor LexA [Candidatus Saccharibacteria bacterium]
MGKVRQALTKKQKKTLDFISTFIEQKGYSPSYREIAEGLKLNSVATVAQHVDTLVAKGLLVKGNNSARSLMPTDEVETQINEKGIQLPILGLIAAGSPIETLEGHKETLEVPPFMVGNKDSYVLQVKGQSMIEDGIHEGDFVVVQEKEVPSNGDVVVALVNGSEATLKRYYKEARRIRLQPANSSMEPIYIEPGTQLKIQGVVIGLIRKY